MFYMNFQRILDTTVYIISLLIIILVSSCIVLVKYCTKLFYITVQKYIRHRERHEQSNGRLNSHQVDRVPFKIQSDISRPSKRINDQVEEDLIHERTKGRQYREFTKYRNSTSNRQKHESTNIHHHGFQQIPTEYNNKHPGIDAFSKKTSHQQRYYSRINIQAQGQPYMNINPYLNSNNDEMGHNNVFRSYHYLVSTRYREKPRTFESWSRITESERLNNQIPPSRNRSNVSERDTNLFKHFHIPATLGYLTPSLSSYFVMKASSNRDAYAADNLGVELNLYTEDKHNVERNTYTENKPFLERNTFTEDKPSVERNTFTEDKPFLERNIFTEDKPSVERNTFTEDKPFLERNTFTGDKLSVERQTFIEDKPDVERNTFTEDKPFLERNTFTEDEPDVERNTFTDDKPSVERNTFTDDKPFIERNTLTEDKPPVERNTFTEDKPFLDRNIFTEDKHDVERNTFTDDKPSVERNTFTEDKHDVERNTFTEDKHGIERNTFTEDKHDVERNTFTEDKHDIERNTFTEDKHDIERNTFTEDKPFLKRNTFTEDKPFVERNAFTEDKPFVERNTFTEDKYDVERNTFTEDKQDVEKNTFTEDKHDIERNTFTVDEHDIERNTFTEDKPSLERNVITVDKTKNTFTVVERNSFTEDKADVQRDEFTNEKLGVEWNAFTVYKPDGERTAHTVYKPDGERTAHTVYKPDGERTAHTVYKPDGDRTTHTVYKPDGERTAHTVYKPDGERTAHTVYKPDGERTAHTVFKPDGDRTTHTVYKPDGERTAHTVYKPDGERTAHTVYKPDEERTAHTVYKPDEERTAHTVYKPDGERTAHTVYKPDEERTAHTVYKPDEERTTHTVYKPDEERTAHTVYKPDGERTTHTQDKQGGKGTSFIAAEYVTSELQITNRKRCIYDDSVSPAVDSKVRKCSTEVKVVTTYGERQVNSTSDNFNSATVLISMFCDTSHTTTSVSNRCFPTDSFIAPTNTRYQTSIPTVAKSAQCLEEEAIHKNNSKKNSIHVAANLFQQAVTEEFHSLPNFSSVGIPEVILSLSQSGRKGPIHTVVFDLETTGLGNHAEIVQLAAQKQDDHFNKYIVPTRPINSEASEITGLYTDGVTLYHNDRKMKTERKMSCLNSFIDWLPDNTILCAHNCKQFDAIIIVSEVTSVNLMTNFKRKVIGFIDTLPLFKANLPGRKSYKQTSLVTDVLGETYETHEAMDDTRLLLKLLTSKNVPLSGFFEHSFTIESVEKYLCDFKRKKDCLRTFKKIIEAKAMSESMAEKAAKTYLRFNDLILAAKGDNVDGLFDLLSKPNESDGKPRLTKKSSVIKKIYEFIKSME